MTNKVTIRQAKIEDLEAIQNLSYGLFQAEKDRDQYLNHQWSYAEYGEKYFRGHIENRKDDKICFVAEFAGEIVGYLAGAVMEIELWRPVKRTELENIFIKEEFRNKQVGTLLVQKFFEWSKEKGVDLIKVTAYASNDKAINFYKQNGFNPQSLTLETKI
jgi:ribosomal protein S18 acetylase RimI-like enzyme